jgi:biotin operon repressor
MSTEDTIKKNEDNVVIYTEDEKIISVVEKVTKELDLNLFKAEDTTELYVTGGFFEIVDPEKVDENYFETIREIHENDDPKEFAILLTKPVQSLPKQLKKIIIQPKENSFDYDNLKLSILRKRSAILRHQKNPRRYDKRLFRLFNILRRLQPEGAVVSKDELAREFNVSEKTIQRDIEILQMSGEDINYDKEKKGYCLLGSWNSSIVARND